MIKLSRIVYAWILIAYAHSEADTNECASNPCVYGACIDGVNKYTCTCPPGYTGTKCESIIDHCMNHNCSHGANCISTVLDFVCVCTTGYSGKYCELDFNECLSSPCKNGGICVDVFTGYKCACAMGFNGTLCETNIDDCVNHECRNGATCVDGVANYTCACADGFIGARCEDGNAVNECMSNPCRNGGTCTDFKGYYTCSCSMLFTGVTCEHALSNSSASGLLRNLSLSINETNYQSTLNLTLNMTSFEKNVTDADVVFAVSILEKYINKSDGQRKKEDIHLALNIVSNIMGTDSDILYKVQEFDKVTNRLIKVMDSLTSSFNVTNGSVTFVGNTVAIRIIEQSASVQRPVIGFQFKSTNSDKISEDSIDDVNSNFDESDDDDIDVVVKFDEALIKGKKARTTFHVYNTVNLFKEMNSTMKMNSKVISAKLKANGKDVTELGANNVTIIFKTFGIRGEQQCVYWNLSLNGGYGGWLTDGCASVRSDNAKITCVCNHLTNFAIIVNPTLDDSVAEILSIVIKVGLSLSIVCLGLVIVAFLAFRHLRRAMGQKVIVNMSAAISIYNLVFVAGMDKSNTYTGCIVVSAFLQYFLLASFMWVFMESLLQYKTLSYMQKPGPRFLWVCLIAAWGIPLIPVIFFLALNHDMYYGDKGYCWFGPRNVGYALVIPLGAIVLANIVILALLAMRLCRWRNAKLKLHQSKRRVALLYANATLTVFVFLAAAWIFSYLSVENTHLAFHYLFAILSAIIGVLIFVLFVTRDREVRKSWNRQCCKQPKVEIIPPSQIELERKIQFEESLQRKVAYSEQIRAGNSLYPKTDNPYRSMFNNSYGSRADNSNLARVDVSGQPMFDIPYKDMVTDSGQVHVVYSNRSKGSNSSQFKGENPDLSKEDRGYTPFNVVGSGY
ncbi:hypothetical protein DPMN_144233 [Dreissena polymorpha]|uniref:Uncharacterized protein n=1 Tax=Dreissena polymorpha TaxID=45954 RepID=A0A9D4GKN7_DREPO|nr:hypothetical protein DPMN_144233 [Dreissena polymorpha]